MPLRTGSQAVWDNRKDFGGSVSGLELVKGSAVALSKQAPLPLQILAFLWMIHLGGYIVHLRIILKATRPQPRKGKTSSVAFYVIKEP